MIRLFDMNCRSKTPRNVPTTVPLARIEAPLPRTTAAMPFSSCPTRSVGIGSEHLPRQLCITPPVPQMIPTIINAKNLVRETAIPARFAASASPPIAYNLRPDKELHTLQLSEESLWAADFQHHFCTLPLPYKWIQI